MMSGASPDEGGADGSACRSNLLPELRGVCEDDGGDDLSGRTCEGTGELFKAFIEKTVPTRRCTEQFRNHANLHVLQLIFMQYIYTIMHLLF